MKRSKIVGRLVTLCVGVALVGSVAWAQVGGVVTAVTPHEITVSGAVYKLDGVTIEDFNGGRISLPELRPGTAVELEFDAEGRLAVIRATVVR